MKGYSASTAIEYALNHRLYLACLNIRLAEHRIFAGRQIRPAFLSPW
jgi:hypothetical protein